MSPSSTAPTPRTGSRSKPQQRVQVLHERRVADDHVRRGQQQSYHRHIRRGDTAKRGERIGIRACTNNATALTSGTDALRSDLPAKRHDRHGDRLLQRDDRALSAPSHVTAGIYDTSATPAVDRRAQCADHGHPDMGCVHHDQVRFARLQGAHRGRLLPVTDDHRHRPDLHVDRRDARPEDAEPGAQFQTGAFDR